MNPIRVLFNRSQSSSRFRILYAKIYPILRKCGLLKVLKSMDTDAGDPWGHVKNDDLQENAFDGFPLKKSDLRKSDFRFVIAFIIDEATVNIENISASCVFLGVDFVIWKITDPNLNNKIRAGDVHGIIIYPAYTTPLLRGLFHEVAQLVSTELNLPTYPKIRELNFYEAKRALKNFLEINSIPHPNTLVFFDIDSANRYLDDCIYPIVFKTHIGSAASGVEILKNRKTARKLASRLFNKIYLRRGETDIRSFESGYMILQEYIPNAKEYRIIKIGDSWWGYQKWKNEKQEFLSGSGVVRWISPTKQQLDFCHNLAKRFDFRTMCFDLFESDDIGIVVNELQVWFGSYNPTQMKVDGVPGRYIRQENEWIFQKGYFNIYGSMVLILSDFIAELENSRSLVD